MILTFKNLKKGGKFYLEFYFCQPIIFFCVFKYQLKIFLSEIINYFIDFSNFFIISYFHFFLNFFPALFKPINLIYKKKAAKNIKVLVQKIVIRNKIFLRFDFNSDNRFKLF